MRKKIAALAVALIVPLVAAGFGSTANAQVTSASPVDALKHQFIDNHGVKMSKVLTVTRRDGEKLNMWVKGVAEFGKGGITATDLTFRSDLALFKGPVRQILFEGRKYVREGALPNGKSWFLSKDKKIHPVLDADWIKLADPVMLKAVLATTATKRPAGVYDGTRTTLYQGTIALGELYRASPEPPVLLEEKPTGQEARIEISWRLWLGEDQLVRRARASWSEPYRDARRWYVADARLTDWDAPTDITPLPSTTWRPPITRRRRNPPFP
ncbi:hypothetical protein AB0395_05860 [Streptosporangium sp. NPDC051023]|uniref:hypothetical protein n=1 Tax=Streptosporangium sp. NPDC051023 TaxID=3155410 RepID=UPI00345103F4